MTPTGSKRAFRHDLVIAALMIATGVGLSAGSLMQLRAAIAQAGRVELAQATPPLQSTPGAESRPAAPNSDITTGARPTATPPQPAQPDADAQKSGAAPALPAAPAEKTAPPITAR